MSDEDRVRGLIDADALARWMDERGLPGKGEPVETRFISGGASNELFEIKRGDARLAESGGVAASGAHARSRRSSRRGGPAVSTRGRSIRGGWVSDGGAIGSGEPVPATMTGRNPAKFGA